MAGRSRSAKSDASKSPASQGRGERFAVLLFFSVSMFCLGLVVGRGQAPIGFDIPDIEARLSALYPETDHKVAIPDKVETGKFEFYEDLKQDVIRMPGGPVEIEPKVSLAKKRLAGSGGRVRGALETPAAPTPKAPEKKTPETKIAKPAPVNTPVAVPETPARKKETPFYTLQVSAHKTPATAAREAMALKEKGLAAYVVSGAGKNGVTWYRVRVGRAQDKAALLPIRKQLAATGVLKPVLYKETP